jgi:hypothetical protein
LPKTSGLGDHARSIVRLAEARRCGRAPGAARPMNSHGVLVVGVLAVALVIALVVLAWVVR